MNKDKQYYSDLVIKSSKYGSDKNKRIVLWWGIFNFLPRNKKKMFKLIKYLEDGMSFDSSVSRIRKQVSTACNK